MAESGKCVHCGVPPKEGDKKTTVKLNGLAYDIYKCFICSRSVWVCRMDKSDVYYQ